MKTSNLSRISLLCGLALGLMVLCSAATPSTTNEYAYLGAWTYYSNPVCCYNTLDSDCYYSPYNCGWDDLEICNVASEYTGKFCGPIGSFTCTGLWPCWDTHNAECV